MEERYLRNIGTITESQQEELRKKKVLVAGCGGLGGYVIELLARVGVGRLVVCDGDVFEETNLNRQLYATESTLGQQKAEAAGERVKNINSTIQVTVVNQLLTEQNLDEVLLGCDLAIDALDNLKSRFALEQACERLDIPYIYGGVNGWFGSVGTVLPGDKTVEKLYAGVEETTGMSTIGMTVAVTAAVEAAEAVKVLTGCGGLVRKLLMIDLMHYKFDVIDLK